MGSDVAGGTANDVMDLALADAGKRRIEWTFQSMPVLQAVRKQLIKTQTLAGLRVAARLHLSAEAANFLIALRDGGASVFACAAASHSVQDEVAASLVRDYGLSVYAVKGEDEALARQHYDSVVAALPRVVVDSGADLLLHAGVECGIELTAPGVEKLKAAAQAGTLGCPVIAASDGVVQNALTSRYGAGQAVLDAIVRATNLLIAGLNVVVAGYGRSGRGIALRARGLGAQVIVCEVDPLRALEAAMDGYRVLSMSEAAQSGDIFVTATGSRGVIGRDHFDKLKNGAILCQTSKCGAEIDLEMLGRTVSSRRVLSEDVEEYAMRDGRRLYHLGAVGAAALPATVLDLEFAHHASCLEYVVSRRSRLENQVYPVPDELDRTIARTKLDVMGLKIDRPPR